jgi:colicin import membrane protein
MTLAENKKPLFYSLGFHLGLVFLMLVRGYYSTDIPDFEKTVRVDIIAMPDKVQKIVEPKQIEAPKEEVKETKTKDEPKPVEKAEPKKDAVKTVSKKEKVEPVKKTPPKPPVEDLKKSELNAFEKLAALKAEKAEAEIEEKQKAIAGNRIAKGTDLVGVEKIEYSNYKSVLHKAISSEWDLPKWLLEGDLRAIALIKIDEDGNLTFKRIVSSSGNSIYDEKVMEAIVDSAPFSKPPSKFKKIVFYEGVQLAFP